MKKTIAILLVTVMLLSLSAFAFADEPTVMRLSWNSGSDSAARNVVLNDLLDEFNATNEYNVKFELELYEPETYKTVVPTLMTQNNMADVFFASNYGFVEPYVKAGKVYCLDEEFEKDPEWLDRFGTKILEGVTFDGKIYGLSHSTTWYPTYYNKEIFNKLNLQVPTTWDEFIAVCDTLIENGITPLAMGGQTPWVMGQFLLRLVAGVGGSETYNAIRSGEIKWTDPKFIEAGELLQSLVEKGIFEENFSGISYDEAISLFTSGQTAMYHMGTWITSMLISEMGADNIGVFYMPAYYEENSDSNLCATGNSLFIAETCKNKEAACALIKMFGESKWAQRLFLEAGIFPASSKVEFDPELVDPISRAILALNGEQEVNVFTPFDILFGENVGGEFNNISVAISTGKDVTEQFEHLQEYAEDEG